jgi:hypothetical protein
VAPLEARPAKRYPLILKSAAVHESPPGVRLGVVPSHVLVERPGPDEQVVLTPVLKMDTTKQPAPHLGRIPPFYAPRKLISSIMRGPGSMPTMPGTASYSRPRICMPRRYM